ncbi:unnamed protein product [Prunus armeniaca]
MSTVESPSAVRKVVVHLRATGDAPILKQAKFKILGTDKFAKVIEFLRRQLHRDTLFVYVNSAFSPNPDELVIDLYNCSVHQFKKFLVKRVQVASSVKGNDSAILDKSGSLFTCIYQHCRILVLMVNWWSIMLAPWHGADTHVSADSTH